MAIDWAAIAAEPVAVTLPMAKFDWLIGQLENVTGRDMPMARVVRAELLANGVRARHDKYVRTILEEDDDE
tara:strand:+ start:32 stop:244 length:213 start_codon:yes stop_codon:yes gene_type:complete